MINRVSKPGKAGGAPRPADRAKMEFLANISHELITPLNNILGFAQLLHNETSGPLNEIQRGHASEVLSNGRRLLGLIESLLTLSTIEAGGEEPRSSRFILKDALRSGLLSFEEEAEKLGISLGLDMGLPEDVEIETDALKLSVILDNLLSNALKFTPGGGAVRLGACLSPDGKAVRVSVSDTGIGIDSKDIRHLFSEFRQLESPYVKRYAGTGIGLALTKKLIDMLGGGLWVESRKGKGSAFTFSLPLRAGGKADGMRRRRAGRAAEGGTDER